MANIAQPQRQIHYISELKKIFVGRNNQPVTQKFKIDTNISDDYYFQIVNKNNQIVSLAGRSFKVYGSYIDAKRQIHILFFTESFSIEDNVLHFHLNTNTNEYNEYITTEYKEIQFTIIETTGANTQVALRDVALAYRRPYIDQDTQVEIVYRDILTGITVPLTGSFGVGENINLFPGANSFAFGEGLITQSENQTVFGQYNEPDAEQLLIFGNGSDDNNRNNIFTVDKYGNAYLSGARVLNNFDRTNISELNNDIGYITYSDIPTFEGKNGIKVEFNNDNKYIFSISATIPSAVSQLVNDTGFITGYTAGSGISIDDGVINCTVEGGGGATYTAGAGIAISDQNVISLTATIPSSIYELDGSSNYVRQINIQNSLAKSSHDSESGITYTLGVDYISLHNAGFAYTSAIPLSTSQLTNDGVYINNLIGGNGINCRRSDFQEPYGREWFIEGKYDDIVASGGLSSYVYDDYGVKTLYLGIDDSVMTGFAATSAIPTGLSQLVNDNNFISAITLNCWRDGDPATLSTNLIGFGAQFKYDTGYDQLRLNYGIVSGHISECGFITSSALTGISSDNQQKMLVDNTVQNSGFVLGYNKDYDIFSNKISTNNGSLNLNPLSGIDSIPIGKIATFEYWVKPNGSLTGITFANGLDFVGQLPSSFTEDYTQVFTVRIIRKGYSDVLQQISYAYEFENIDPKDVPLTFKAVNGPATLRINTFGSPPEFVVDCKINNGSWTSYTMGDDISLNEGDTVSLSGNNNQICTGSGWRRFAVTGSVESYGNVQSLVNWSDTVPDSCYSSMFNMGGGLLTAPRLFGTTLGSYAYDGAFWGCSNLSSIEVDFTDWGNNDQTRDWLNDVAANGIFIKPTALPTEFGSNRIPNGWTVINK